MDKRIGQTFRQQDKIGSADDNRLNGHEKREFGKAWLAPRRKIQAAVLPGRPRMRGGLAALS
jgi:hypothetical protein